MRERRTSYSADFGGPAAFVAFADNGLASFFATGVFLVALVVDFLVVFLVDFLVDVVVDCLDDFVPDLLDDFFAGVTWGR